MADDWQIGDLALCIRRPEGETGPPLWEPVVGGCYVVSAVDHWPDWTGLDFVEDPYLDPNAQWNAVYFRKIHPHAPDAEDEETIRLLNGAPVAEEA